MGESKLPKHMLETIRDMCTFAGRPVSIRENEVFVLKLLVDYANRDLHDGTCPNPPLLRESLAWFKMRLDELGAGEVRS